MTLQEFVIRDSALRHAIQTGVAYEMGRGGRATEPKHLRTGLDSAMADIAGLVGLLVDKGVFTQEEYFEASIKALEGEVKRYEERLSEAYGIAIKLG